MTEANIKLLERIQGLISKAESTEFAEEAEAFMAKAQELLAKYSLSEFDLKLVKDGQMNDTVKTIAVLISEPCAPAKLQLIGAVARANNVKVVRGQYQKRSSKNAVPNDWRTKEPMRILSSDNKSVNYRTAWLTGFTRDIDAVTMLYTSMLIQINATLAKEDIPAYVNRGTFMSHFIQGFATTVRVRLAKAKGISEKELIDEARENGHDMLPILKSRLKQVEAEYERMWAGSLSTGRGGYNRTSTGGFNAGSTAGGRADIGQKGVGGIGALGRGGN